MSKTFLAGIDVGTTGAKTGIFDLDGKLISSGYVEYTCSYPKPNWVEQDAKELAEAALESASQAISKSGIDPKNIASVSASTQRTCSIFIDKDGNPIYFGVDYGRFTPYLIKAFQEQQTQINQQQEIINTLINSTSFKNFKDKLL